MSDADHDLVLDYVLGEIPEADRGSFEQRLRVEPDLARAVSRCEEVVALAVLADTPETPAPAADLRARLLAEVTEDRVVPIAAGRGGSWGWGMAAALALAATIFGVVALQRGDRIAELNDQLAQARQMIESVSADLAAMTMNRETLVARIAQLESSRQLDSLRIAALSSQLEQASQAFGFAVFDPATDEGLIEVIDLPAIDRDSQDYQLWVVDPQYENPVDGGVLEVGADGKARVRFRAKQPVTQVAAFAVSLERKGGVPVAEGPMVLVGAL